MVGKDVLPKIGDPAISYGSIADFIRDGLYPSRKSGDRIQYPLYYLLETGDTLPRGLRFMFEVIKENGNVASHNTSLMDDYVTLSVFYAFCSLILWLYKNKDEMKSGKMRCFGEQNNDPTKGWSPKEGVVDVVTVNRKPYFYCEGVHISQKCKDGSPAERGKRIRINKVNPEKEPKVLGVVLYSDNWEFIE